MLRKKVRSLSDIEALQEGVRKAAQYACANLNALKANPLEALHTLKFEEYGYHPLVEGQRVNLIEQLNQTFTILASLAASRLLMKWFPESDGLYLNLGTAPGRDIESITHGVVEAEVFAAVNPRNNNKLSKDIRRLADSQAAHRYVFFYAPGHDSGRQQHQDGVQVWALEWQEII